jgi:UTP--glucose-1-phosphate uridylyltransferase
MDGMITKVVVPAAGLGTRLFPATKEQPKEMLPIFSRLANGKIAVKPLLQMVFEQLHDAGFKEFCFVVGRGKRGIEDHFTPDYNSIHMLKSRRLSIHASDLDSFYSKLRTSTILWVNQPEPRGFGDAVFLSRPFVQGEQFLVHAGDTYIVSNDAKCLSLLISVHERLKSDATFFVHEIEDPRKYGIIEGNEVETGVIKVRRTIEKPERPPTNLAIVAIYAFNPVIFKALENARPGKNGEIQLTDAIQRMIDWRLNVHAVKLDRDALTLDIGSPETYWEALSSSYRCFLQQNSS